MLYNFISEVDTSYSSDIFSIISDAFGEDIIPDFVDRNQEYGLSLII
jgi:hypothetical protein